MTAPLTIYPTQTESALRESEERLRLATEATNAGTFDYNIKTGELYCSDKLRTLCGFSKHEKITADEAASIIHEDDKLNVMNAIIASLDPAGSGELEFEYCVARQNDRQIKWVYLRSKVFFEGEGDKKQPVRVTGIIIDVTERKKTEQALQESESRFRTMANEAPLFVWETDEKLQTIFLNKTGLRYFDYDEKPGLNKLSWKNYIHPDDIDRVLDIMKHHAQIHQSYSLEMRLKNGLTGQYRWFLDKGSPKYKDEIFTGFIGTSLDIHDRKEAEKELENKVKERTKELDEHNRLMKKQNDLIKKILDSSIDLIVVYDTETRVISINESSLELLGMTEEQVIGKKITDVIPQMKDTKGYEDLLRAIKGETIHNEVYFSSVTARYYENFLVPLRDDNDNIYAVLVMAHDNTGLITSAENLKLKNEELQRSLDLLHSQELRDEQKNNFIAMASHELKTPITSIKGYVQLLLNALSKEKDENKVLSPLLVRSSLISVDKQVTRLTRLISELLDLSKIETGTLELRKEKFSLNELAIETIEDILYTNASHHINLYHDFHSYVYADKDRIGQVMINFLTNAIKYSPASTRIDVTLFQSAKDEIAFSVKDFGIGIDKDEQQKIFERFYRAKGKEEQTYPGFGIGLFIANEFVQKHGGRMLVESEKGKGSIFTFTLPVYFN